MGMRFATGHWREMRFSLLIMLALASCSGLAVGDPGAARTQRGMLTPSPGAGLLALSYPSLTPEPDVAHTRGPGTGSYLAAQPTVTPTYAPTQTLAVEPTGLEPAPPPAFDLCSPLEDYPREKLDKIVSAPYRPPPPGWDERHQGVDFVFHRRAGVERSILGVGVQSVLYGKVAAVVHDSFPYGNLVIVETPREHLPSDLVEELEIAQDESLYLLYAHMQEGLLVELGQTVACCQLLGTVGASGNTEAPHLHLETRAGPAGAIFPVMSAFTVGTTPEQRAYYDLWRTSRAFRHFDPMRLLEYEWTS